MSTGLFAQFDPNASDPRPVLGWYDTSHLTYAAMPAADCLLELTQAQWDARAGTTYLQGGVPIAYLPPTPPPTLAQQAAALLAAGLAITSTGTLGLNATYPTDARTQSKAASIELRLAAGLGFPGGTDTFPWVDSAGQWHALTQPQFSAIAGAISVFVTACDQVIDGYPEGILPTAAATIP